MNVIPYGKTEEQSSHAGTSEVETEGRCKIDNFSIHCSPEFGEIMEYPEIDRLQRVLLLVGSLRLKDEFG